MARGVEIKTLEVAQEISFPALHGLSATGSTSTKSVIANDEALFLWVHQMAPNASVLFAAPKVGHLMYVWKGALRVDGQEVKAEQVVVVEHTGFANLEASQDGATLVHFHQSEKLPLLTERPGGGVHVAPAKGLFSRWDEERRADHTVWFDAHCATCELWLHRSKFQVARGQGEPHMHNEDEIIFVLDGGIVVGKIHDPGTAIAVSKGTIYSFGVAAGGGSFINFRATNPLVKMMQRGKPIGDWVSERAFMRNELQVPVIDPRAKIVAA